MIAASSRDWNGFKPIFADHWEPFPQAHPRSQTAYDASLVAKRLACGTREKIGESAYRCRPCGQGTPLVARRWKSSLGWRCAKVSVDHWGSQVSRVLHEGGISRPILLTVPAMVRTTFDHNATVVLNAFMRGGAQWLDDFYGTVRGQALKGGSLTVRHTPGRHGQYPPHLPRLATSGGYEAQGARWEPLASLPSARLRRKWPWPLLPRRRQTRKTDAVKRLVAACFRPSPNGLVTNVPQGAVPSQ